MVAVARMGSRLVLAAAICVGCTGPAITPAIDPSLGTGRPANGPTADVSRTPTPLPDRSAMEAVVKMVEDGKFPPGQGQTGFNYLASLPPQFAGLSVDGAISIVRNTKSEALD